MSTSSSRAFTPRDGSTPWSNSLTANGFTYEKDGALWLRTTAFGDDKDRVMRKADGSYTYFVPDVAYHREKWRRGFSRVINEQGADHHSTITRVRAGLQALQAGIPEGWPDYLLHQMVTVLRGGQEVKISKRAGSYVTLRDLIDEVGRDATRFFFLMRKADAQLVFDIDLAKQQSNENPVYYVQYAHARVCSISRNAAEQGMVLPAPGTVDPSRRLPSRRNWPWRNCWPGSRRRLPAPPSSSIPIASPLPAGTGGPFHSYYNRQRVICDDVPNQPGPALPGQRGAHRARQRVCSCWGFRPRRQM